MYDGWEFNRREEVMSFPKVIGSKNILLTFFGNDPDQLDPVSIFLK